VNSAAGQPSPLAFLNYFSRLLLRYEATYSSSRILRLPSASSELISEVRISAHQDTEVSHHCASEEANNVSSTSFHDGCVDVGLSGLKVYH